MRLLLIFAVDWLGYSHNCRSPSSAALEQIQSRLDNNRKQLSHFVHGDAFSFVVCGKLSKDKAGALLVKSKIKN